MTEQKVPLRVYTAFGVSIFTLSQAAVLVRLSQASPEVLGFWRMLIAVGLTFGMTRVAREKVLTDYVRNNLVPIAFAGALFFLHFWIWFHAVSRTTIANATLLFCINPLFISIGAWVFQKERVTWRLALALGLGVAGLVVMEWESVRFSSEKFTGDLLALLAAVAFAGYVLATKKLRASGSNYALTFWFNVICSLGFALTLTFHSQNLTNYPWISWVSFLAMALGPSILGHALFSYSLRFLNASVASCFVLLEPVFAAITASWVFGETVTMRTIYGFILITVGLLNLFLFRNAKA